MSFTHTAIDSEATKRRKSSRQMQMALTYQDSNPTAQYGCIVKKFRLQVEASMFGKLYPPGVAPTTTIDKQQLQRQLR